VFFFFLSFLRGDSSLLCCTFFSPFIHFVPCNRSGLVVEPNREDRERARQQQQMQDTVFQLADHATAEEMNTTHDATSSSSSSSRIRRTITMVRSCYN
jgi:hypothetical protein